MNQTTAPNRKTGRLIVKNLIILLVLAVVVFLAAWAWFTQQSTAVADGINIVSKASGVKVSWDDKNYYDNLTAMSDDEVEAGVTGLAKNFGTGTSPLQLEMITGNGLSFFKPSLNLRSGEVITDSSGEWQGKSITDENSAGHYVDVDLYFKGDSAKDIYLAGDSKLSPKSTTERMSDYGNFSTDCIASAARVAFLNGQKDSCNFIWAPNADYELKESDTGYTKVTDVKTETIESGSGSGGTTGGIPEDILCENDNNSYYLWLPKEYDEDTVAQLSGMTANPMKFLELNKETGEGLFICDYKIDTPNNGKDITIPFAVNIDQAQLSPSDIDTYVDKSRRTDYVDNSDDNPKVSLSSEFNINFGEGVTQSAPAFYITSGFNSYPMSITIGYNPYDRTVIILKYKDTSGTIDKNYDITETETSTVEVSYYELNDGDKVVLANPDNAVAVKSDDSAAAAQGVTFKTDEKTAIVPHTVSGDMIFTTEKTGSGYNAKYKFKDSGNQYLTLTGESVTFTASGTEFSLKYIGDYSGPALFDGTHYLSLFGGRFTVMSESEFETNRIVSIYKGSSYEMIVDSKVVQDYTFYDAVNKELQTLSESSTPPLYTSKSTDAETTIIDENKPVAALQQDSNDPTVYKAHIVMRIWVEGTDRDALLPLKGGLFNMSLHFTAKTNTQEG